MSTAIHQQLDETIRHALASAAAPPQQRQSPPLARWTLKRLVGWVKQQFGIDCCRETVRKVLKQLGLSWKKAHKPLNKGKPDQRAAFLERLQGLLADALHERCLRIYIDEAPVYLDTDVGYGWAICGFGSVPNPVHVEPVVLALTPSPSPSGQGETKSVNLTVPLARAIH